MPDTAEELRTARKQLARTQIARELVQRGLPAVDAGRIAELGTFQFTTDGDWVVAYGSIRAVDTPASLGELADHLVTMSSIAPLTADYFASLAKDGGAEMARAAGLAAAAKQKANSASGALALR